MIQSQNNIMVIDIQENKKKKKKPKIKPFFYLIHCAVHPGTASNLTWGINIRESIWIQRARILTCHNLNNSFEYLALKYYSLKVQQLNRFEKNYHSALPKKKCYMGFIFLVNQGWQQQVIPFGYWMINVIFSVRNASRQLHCLLQNPHLGYIQQFTTSTTARVLRI